MKIIKSDKIGRNIHSPFVYRLIANVLFAPYPFYAFPEINILAKCKNEQMKLQMLFRLINHFQFDNTIILGLPDKKIEKVCRLAKSNINILNSNKISINKYIQEEEKYTNLVIVNDIKCLTPGIFPEGPEIWLWFEMDDIETADNFRQLRTKEEARVTIELNQFGIAIFNKDFEKQNYVIKH